jgi:carbamoyl-phosphate synthase small subunit
MSNSSTVAGGAILALADGSVFQGRAFGAKGVAVGEVVFNTAMTGYQEILTDPSYAEQMVCLTYPHIGNVGTNREDEESPRIWAKGLIMRDPPRVTSNWRSEADLAAYLQHHHTVAISDIDTRRLTRHLRERGAQNGCIVSNGETAEFAIQQAQLAPSLAGRDLAKVVGTKEVYTLEANGLRHYHLVVYDFGVKRQILTYLQARGCRLTVVPPQTPVESVLSYKPDGIVLSNGPGDPAACDYAINAIRALLDASIPLLGICLGIQLLALASGGKTFKMRFGHHGANHPVLDTLTQKVLITSQNHGFAVDEASLSADWQVTHRSLFDNTLQGFRHKTKPIMALQGHPEASPGPQDMVYCFDQYIDLLRTTKE